MSDKLSTDKPPIEELRYFLEFQIPRVWAPARDTIPGQQRKEPVCPSLQFSIMGQKLYVSQEQVKVIFSFYFIYLFVWISVSCWIVEDSLK